MAKGRIPKAGLAEASIEAARILVWQIVRHKIVSASCVAAELEKAEAHVAPHSRYWLRFLAATARLAGRE